MSYCIWKYTESTCQKKIWVDDTKKISFSCYHFLYAGFAAVFDFWSLTQQIRFIHPAETTSKGNGPLVVLGAELLASKESHGWLLGSWFLIVTFSFSGAFRCCFALWRALWLTRLDWLPSQSRSQSPPNATCISRHYYSIIITLLQHYTRGTHHDIERNNDR